MLSYNEKRIQRLVQQGKSYIGMIGEVKAKAALLKLRLNDAESDNFDLESIEIDAGNKIVQMRADLAKYSHRLNCIYEELDSYGLFTEVNQLE